MEGLYGVSNGAGDIYMLIRDHYLGDLMTMMGSGVKVKDTELLKYVTTTGSIRAKLKPPQVEELRILLISKIDATIKSDPSAEQIAAWEEALKAKLEDPVKAANAVDGVVAMAKAADETLRQFLKDGLKR